MRLVFFRGSMLGLGDPRASVLQQPRCKVEWKGDFKWDNAYSSLSLIFPSSSSSSFPFSSLPFMILLPFFFVISLVCLPTLIMDPPRLLGDVCLGFNVTINALWHILMRLGFWAC